MNLKHLKFFITLAKTEHMARAADLLGISQPSLSYAINNLEIELGVPLFEKDGRNIKLTNYGKIYLKYVEKSISALNEGSKYIEELLDINSGHINFGFTFTMGESLVPMLIHEFKKNPQRKNISFSFKQGTTSDLINDLVNDQLDLIIASKPKEKTDKINVCHLINQEMMVAVPLNHPLAKKNSITIKELASYPLILYSKKSGLRPDIDNLFNKSNITPNIRLESIEDHSIIGFVHWGYGVAIIPSLPQLAKDQVKLLRLKNVKNWHPLYTITKANHFLAPSASLFFDFCQNYCRQNYLNLEKLI